jgi:hypothetical protein
MEVTKQDHPWKMTPLRSRNWRNWGTGYFSGLPGKAE